MSDATDELLHLAEASLDAGQPEAALSCVRRVLAERPDDLAARWVEAEALRDLHEREEAADCYRALLAADADHTDAWAGLAHVLFEDGAFEEASTAARRALRLDPEHPEALAARSLLRERRGDLAGARRDQLRAWRRSPAYPLPTPLTDDALRNLLADAAEGLDDGTRAWIEATAVVVADLPDLATCRTYDPPASPAELLGHVAARLLHEPGEGWAALPPSIVVYRRNLERYADDREHLVEALREGVLAQVADAVGAATLDE
jgi:tetratricopeptide (TPR) repeat protein